MTPIALHRHLVKLTYGCAVTAAAIVAGVLQAWGRA